MLFRSSGGNLSSQPNTRSMVLKRSLNMSALNNGFRPRLADFLPLGLVLILGTMPRLKIAFRFCRQSYTPSRLTIVPRRSRPTKRATRITFGKAARRSGDSLWLPGAATNGATTLQFRSQKATTLSPLIFLCALKPTLSPPFFAAVVVPSPCM